MILKELQNFILEHHRVSLAEMELHFHMDGDALRQILKKLVQKGRVRQLPIPEHCDGCTFCNLDAIEFYEWIDKREREEENSDSSQLTKTQIHSTNVSEEETGIKDATIFNDCQKNH
ncbi:MAG: FeoC-like transcriptional regulator [Halothece sp.]